LVEGCLLEIEIKNCAKLQLFNYSRGYYARHLVKLSLENCPNLEIADCSNNSLTELTLHQTEKLTRLNCENNQLISLDLRDHFNLEEVKCSGNQLTELLLGELKELVRLECQNNQLANLEVNGCSDLGKLDCQNNKLTTLEVGNLKELNELQCSNNLLINLDLSNNKELEILNISNNKFQEQTLDFLAHLFKLENLLLEHNELVGSLKPLRCMSRLKVLNISYTNVDSGLEHLSNSLEKFYCSNKQGYKVEEIEKELKGKVIAKKDYITSHYPDSSYNSYGYSGNNDKNKNPNYADYPTYEFKHHRPSDGNFTSILQE
jgi:Leucine-rich repeat (LRR) protein